MEGWWWGKEEPPSITFFLFKFRISPSSKKYQHGLNGRLNPLSVAGSFVVMSNVYRRVGGRCGEGRGAGETYKFTTYFRMGLVGFVDVWELENSF